MHAYFLLIFGKIGFLLCRAHMKEKFVADLRKARESYTGKELAEVSICFSTGQL